MPAGTKIYYSTVEDPSCVELDNPGNYTTNAADKWSETPPYDITTVKSIKIEFVGLTLNTNDEVVIEWPMRAPLVITSYSIHYTKLYEMGTAYQIADAVAKQIPFELNITIEKALEKNPDLKAMYLGDAKIHELMDMAKKVEGMPRHASTHAAGVVITKEPVSEYVPLQKNEDSIVTQFTMTTLESLGLLKSGSRYSDAYHSYNFV